MPSKTAIIVGILGCVVIGLGAYSLLLYFSIPQEGITVTTSLGELPVSTFYRLDSITSITLVITGISILIVAGAGRFGE